MTQPNPRLSSLFELEYPQSVGVYDSYPQIQAAVTKHKIRLPRELILITKQFLYFDRYARMLAPNLNMFRDPRIAMQIMQILPQLQAAQSAGNKPAVASA